MDKDDPGGTTNYGISQRAYPNLDIKNLTLDQAKEIYYRDYWLRASCNTYEYPLCVILMDTVVNNGVGWGKSAITATISANLEDTLTECKDLLNRRLARYDHIIEKNPKLQKYEKGWHNRLDNLAVFCDINWNCFNPTK